jgi:ABC-type multidrug transport system ATPase subunit
MENFRIFGKGIGLSSGEIEDEADGIMKTLNFPQYRDALVKNLSGGTAQKLNFGIALLGEPDIFILDEPYQGLDYASFLAFWDIQLAQREKGKAIVIVSHLIEDKSKFTRSFHLVEGQLLADPESIT